MFGKKSDDLYRMTVGFNDGDVLYDNCVVHPQSGEVVGGQFTLEPFDSLYSRFIAFDLQARSEIDTRAKDTWDSILDFVESLDATLVTRNWPYEFYIREVSHLKTLIAAVYEDGGAVDYPATLRSLYKNLERYEDARRK